MEWAAERIHEDSLRFCRSDCTLQSLGLRMHYTRMHYTRIHPHHAGVHIYLAPVLFVIKSTYRFLKASCSASCSFLVPFLLVVLILLLVNSGRNWIG
jgi:hypothetical protein